MNGVVTAQPSQVVEVDLGSAGDGTELIDVDFVTPVGRRSVPAFTSGGRWKVRYAAGEAGEHRYSAEGLDGADGVIRVAGPPDAAAALQLRVTADGRSFETADGSHFLWLADTWWDALTRPGDLHRAG